MRAMVRTGLWLNLLWIALLTTWLYLLAMPLLGIAGGR